MSSEHFGLGENIIKQVEQEYGFNFRKFRGDYLRWLKEYVSENILNVGEYVSRNQYMKFDPTHCALRINKDFLNRPDDLLVSWEPCVGVYEKCASVSKPIYSVQFLTERHDLNMTNFQFTEPLESSWMGTNTKETKLSDLVSCVDNGIFDDSNMSGFLVDYFPESVLNSRDYSYFDDEPGMMFTSPHLSDMYELGISCPARIVVDKLDH